MCLSANISLELRTRPIFTSSCCLWPCLGRSSSGDVAMRRVMDDVIFADNEPWRHVDIVARVAQLWRCAQANAPAASQWLCCGVLDDGGHRD